MKTTKDIRGALLRLQRSDIPTRCTGPQKDSGIAAFSHIDKIEYCPVEAFGDYDKLPTDDDDVFKYERRKVNLCAISGMEPINTSNTDYPDIFNDAKYPEYPVILITMFEFIDEESTGSAKALCKEYREDGVALECFDSLGVADIITAVRVKTFYDGYTSLGKIFDNISVKSAYTVPGIFKSLKDNWREHVETNVVIHISLRVPNTNNARGLLEKIESSGALTNPSLSMVYGKFDFEINGTIQDTAKLYRLFFGEKEDEHNYLSESADYFKKNILLTNTQFLRIAASSNGTDADVDVTPSGADEGHRANLRKHIAIFETEDANDAIKKHLTRTERSTLWRLLGRIYYVTSLPYRNAGKSDDLFGVGGFLFALAMSQVCALEEQANTPSHAPPNSTVNSNLLTECIQFAHAYIENRYMSLRRDFETQDKFNLSYGESAKLTNAYIELSDDIASILTEARTVLPGKNNTQYKFFPIIDFSPTVILKEFKHPTVMPKSYWPNNGKNPLKGKEQIIRGGFFRLPLEQAYNVSSVIAMFLHEAGHMIRVCRTTRNKHFVEQLLPILLGIELHEKLKPILTKQGKNLDKNQVIVDTFLADVFGNNAHRQFKGESYINKEALWDSICVERRENCGGRACHDCKGPTGCEKNIEHKCSNHFANLVTCIKTWVNAHIPKIATHKHLNGREISVAEMAASICNEVDAFSALWSEAVADIMLWEMLEFDTNGYMHRMAFYLRKIRQKFDFYRVIRVCAVCMYGDPRVEGADNAKARGDIMNLYFSHDLFKHNGIEWDGRERKLKIEGESFKTEVIFTYADKLRSALRELLYDSYKKILAIEGIKKGQEKIRDAYGACNDIGSNRVNEVEVFINSLKFVADFSGDV